MATPPPAGASCWICLEEDPDDLGLPLKRNCACRGDAGWAHVSCIASNALHRYEHAWDHRGREEVVESKKLNAIWTTCQHCMQEYQGEVALSIAAERMKSVENLPESDYRYISSLMSLGMIKVSHGPSEGAGIEPLEKVLEILHNNKDGEEDFFADMQLDVLGCLAMAYLASGDTERASECMQKCEAEQGEGSGGMQTQLGDLRELMEAMQPGNDNRNVASLTRLYKQQVEESGKDDATALNAAQLLATALLEAGRYDESIAMHRDTYERTKRILGPGHPGTVDSRRKFFLANGGYGPRKAKLASAIDSRLNGKEVVILRATKDGKKYIVDMGEGGPPGSPRVVKVSPKQLCFVEGTPVTVRTPFGDCFDAFVDSLQGGNNTYGIWVMVREGGFEHMDFARDSVTVKFIQM